MGSTRSTDRLAAELARLPGVGRRTAQTMVQEILKMPQEEAVRLARLIVEVRKKTRACATCFTLAEEERCPICADPGRDRAVICVVEEAHDLAAIEKARAYRGLYHVLGGVLSPLEGIGPDELRVRELLGRVRAGGVREVLIATNPTLEGEATALYLGKQLKGLGAAVTRLARGVPVGGELEYLDEMTLAKAIENRREV
ncbi:MAG TPA: recombination mediator RecR [bacterium]